jgi:hypothetical protein
MTKKMHEETFNILSHKVNAHKIILYFCLTIVRMAIIKETTTKLTRGMEEKPSYNVAGNVNCSGWMSQDGGYSKN